MWISLYDLFANSKSEQSEFLLRNYVIGLSGQMRWLDRWREGGRERDTDTQMHTVTGKYVGE